MPPKRQYTPRMYIDFLVFIIAESKGENPNYTSMVLDRIKGLDKITINITFPAASHFQYANQLELQEEREK